MRSGLILAVLLIGCPPRPEPAPLPPPRPRADAGSGCLSPFPAMVDFGEIDAFTDAFSKVRITNITLRDLAFTIAPLQEPFLIAPAGEIALSPGGSMLFDVHFQPRDSLLHFAALEGRSEGCVITVPLRGLGGGSLGVTPAALDFGVVEPGQSKTLELELSNTRRTPVVLENLLLLDVGSFDGGLGPFSWTVPSRLELAPLSVTTLSITAAPRSFERFSARLTIPTQRTQITVPLVLIGGLPVAQVSPSSLELPRIGFTAGSVPPSFIDRPVALRNLATDGGSRFSDLRLVEPFFVAHRLDGGLSDDLQLQAEPHAFSGIPGGSEALVVIGVRPPSLGEHRYRVTLFTNDPHQPQQMITLNANAVTLPDCLMQVSPPSVVLFVDGPDAGTTGALTFTNTGPTPCVLDDVRVADQFDPTPFHLLSGEPEQRELAPGQAHTVIIGGPDAGPFNQLGALTFHVFNPNSEAQFIELHVSAR